MTPNKIIPYDPKLKLLARKLRKNMTLAEVLLWQEIRRKRFGVEFHLQVPMLSYIVDFYCHELMLAIEVDGSSHQFQKVQVKDIKRQEELESFGVRFIRFSDMEVKRNMNEVRRKLAVRIEQLLETSP